MDLALAQFAVAPAAPDRNRERARELIAAAAGDGIDLVVLPELFTVGFFAFDAYERSAEPLDGETATGLADAAREHGVAVLAGSFVEDLAATRERGFDAPDGALANTAVLLDRAGERRAVYRKRHLFGYDSREAELLTPGESLAAADLGGHTVGISTCYDLRFPELYRRYLDRGVTLVLVPSAWPYPRIEHWRALPRARAVENLCYVAAANGVGRFEDGELCGRSTVYDPWGTPVATTGDRPETVHATADPERVAAVREEFPALRDRREDER
jgi:predicted amidohydrolase